MPLDEKQTFFRWVGGKRRLVSFLRRFFPCDVQDRVYREPFLGGASMFLSILPRQAFLSDLNEELISTFRFVGRDPDLISRYLRQHSAAHGKSYYYRQREVFNRGKVSSFAQAARFIYLNRTCFNGIFRVNRSGEFNVPFGRIANPLFPGIGHLRKISSAFEGAELFAADYREALRKAARGDFVYVDPPYPPLNGTSYFSHYTAQRFHDSDQAKVAEEVRMLSREGVLIMVSNADTQRVRELYAGFNLSTVPVTRAVSCKNHKVAVQELVITNYNPENPPRIEVLND